MLRGLFFHTYKRKWDLPIKIVTPNLFLSDERATVRPHAGTLNCVDASRNALAAEKNCGENPQVFVYRIRYEPEEEAFAFAGHFYEGFEVYSFSSRRLTIQNQQLVEQPERVI